jgi:acyl-coenzyme A thioesterase PaaI-like protein
MSTDFFMDNACFACGVDNEHGLRLRITESGTGVQADIHLPQWTQGYKKTVHGGIISTVLDEMTVWAAYKRGYRCITAELCVRWKTAMSTEKDYTAHAWVTNIKHRLVQAESEIRDENHNVVAFAEAKLLRVE